MIQINGKYFPSGWEELSTEQWLGVVDSMLEFGSRKCDFTTFQIRLVESIVGKLPHDPSNAVLCENFFRLTELFSWPYVYTYKDERYDRLSDRTKELLRHHLPSQLDQGDPEVRIASSFEARVDFDLCFAAQLLPCLPSDPGMRGYRFSCRGTLASTSITARQYVSAMSLLEALSPDAEYQDEILSSLLCVLYYSAIFPFQRYAPNYLEVTLGVDNATASQLFSFFPILAMCLTPLLGIFLDRKGKGATMLMLGAVIMIVCHLSFAFVLPIYPYPHKWLAVTLIAVLGVSFSLVPAALWPSVPKIIDEKILGSAYCLIFWVQNIGLCLVPLLIGKVLQSTGGYLAPMIIFSSFGILAFIFSFLLKSEDRRKGYGLELPNVVKKDE